MLEVPEKQYSICPHEYDTKEERSSASMSMVLGLRSVEVVPAVITSEVGGSPDWKFEEFDSLDENVEWPVPKSSVSSARQVLEQY